ncbi:uncharacterized protein METZ01_LOCUS126222 [marine metagenome]|uniref:HMA domain-containing protein n=1 Tax=marine metagenome TaxID=408172 RepID=A0A381Y8M3_9ZZZZ
MHCAGCVSTIERAVYKVEGVTKAVVSLSKETVRVDGGVSSSAVINAITSTGYEATPMDPTVPQINQEQIEPQSELKQLFPLFLIFFYISSAALLINWTNFNASNFMFDFMGLFFIVFSFFKILDYKNFPHSFAMYDPIAKRFSIYGWIYPAIETVLGLAFLFRVTLNFSLIATIIILGTTTVGVTKALIDKRAIQCACLGTALKLPMTKATFIENSIMIIMATYMLFSL